MTTTMDPIAAHVDYVQRLLALTSKPETARAVQAVFTHGQDTAAPAAGRLALIGSAAAPRVALITKVTPTRVQVSYLTESGIRHGRTMAAYNSHPIHLDSWPETYRDNARTGWHKNPERQLWSTEDDYANYHYEWALKTQAVYRAVTHCPWVAFAPIRHAWIRRHHLAMIPENGETK